MPRPDAILRPQSASAAGDAHALVSRFYADVSEIGEMRPVGADEMPTTYQALLAHDDHMTVTLEAHHGSLVDVVAVDELAGDGWYARTSVLARQTDGAPVQFGVMRVALDGLPAVVVEQIEQRAAPLGRLLIRHNLLREVEVLAYWRIEPGPLLRRRLNVNSPIYGRSARIVVEGRPAVELLEIVHTASGSES